MKNGLLLLSTWVLMSCVEPIVVDNVEENEVSAGSKTNYEGGESLGGQSEVTRPDRLTCNVGEALDLCVVCGPNNNAETALNDDRCEPIDCTALNTYRIFTQDDGRQECRQRPYTPGPAICQGQGACFTNPMRYCELQLEETVLSSEDIGECFELAGCEGQTEYSLVPKPGAQCRQNLGTCNEEGECITEPSCITLFNFEYSSANRICTDRLATQNYCEFFVVATDSPWGAELSCDQFCGAMGGSCLEAWDDRDNNCDKDGGRVCSATFGDGICRCAPAPM